MTALCQRCVSSDHSYRYLKIKNTFFVIAGLMVEAQAVETQPSQ
jgi:hypothetical protein